MGTVLAIVGIASSLSSLGVGIAEAVSAPSAPKPPVPVNLAQEQAQAAEAAAQAEATALMKRRGMASTMLTGPMGPTAQPATQRATLGT